GTSSALNASKKCDKLPFLRNEPAHTGEYRTSIEHHPVSRQGYKNRADEKRLFLKGYQNSHDKEAGRTICRSRRKAWCCRGVHARSWNGRGRRNSLLVPNRIGRSRFQPPHSIRKDLSRTPGRTRGRIHNHRCC